LGASYQSIFVLFGALTGLAIISIIAVYAGKFLASKLSERLVLFTAGCLFIFYAILMLVNNLNIIKL